MLLIVSETSLPHFSLRTCLCFYVVFTGLT